MEIMIRRLVSLLLMAAVIGAVTACGVSGAAVNNANENDAAYGPNAANIGPSMAADGEKVINIGVTDSLGSINPFATGQTEINKYAVDLMFLPLVEMDKDMNFQGMLADSVTTEDNIHFIVHIDDNATWSDGTPVTAYDVEFSVLRYASPLVKNYTSRLYAFEGTDDVTGFVEEGASSMSGLTVLDDKTIQFTAKQPMALMTFQNSYGRYLHILPKHVIENIAENELTSNDWFNQPDVISGPYFLTSYDPDQYISYTANTGYWKGAPQIDKLNIRIIEGDQIYSGLQSGEIDITHHTMTAIPQEDYESIERLNNVRVVYGSPVINMSAFIQTMNIPDARVRQAMLYAIDRQQLVDQLLKGHGEVVDGFLTSASPFFDTSIQTIDYDPLKAAALLEDAGWDSTRILRFYVPSGDNTFANGAQVIAEQWAEIGINAEIIAVDMATLMMTVAGTADYDIMAVPYICAPDDPYSDIEWLLRGERNWTGYYDEEIAEVLRETQQTNNPADIKACYSVIDRKMQIDVPMFSVYVIKSQGVVNNRVVGAEPSVYGFFIDIQNWDVKETGNESVR